MTRFDDVDDQPRSKIPWILGGVFLIMIVAGVALWSRFGEDPGLVASPLIGEPVPPLTLPYLEGQGQVDLAAAGGVTVVNFWASWCLPCRTEHPGLLQTAAFYEDSGVRLVGILYQDRTGSAVEFLDDLGRGYEYVVDDRSRAAIEFGVFGIPETFFVDATGTVVGKISGEADQALLRATLDAILAGETVGDVAGGERQGS